jgi:type II secretory pathway pseudopilin PulG
MLKMKSRNKSRGIGLLELMLSLSIIAVLLVMATRYFMVANEEQKINNAISQIHGIAGGAANYAISFPGYAGVAISSLVNGNFIPASFGGSDGAGAGANPWNGGLSVGAASVNGAAGFTVTMSAVPTIGTPSTCNKLANMISNEFKNSATCSAGQVTVNFN